MKKILALLVATLFLTACGQSDLNNQNQPADINPDQNNETQLTEEELSEQAESERRIMENDLSVYQNSNESELSLESCDDFLDPIAKSSCVDMYYYDQAQINKNSSICESIQEEEFKSDCQAEF